MFCEDVHSMILGSWLNVVTFFNGYDVVGSAGDKILDDDKAINLMDVEFRYETEINRWNDENHVQMKTRLSVDLQFK